MKVLVTGTSGRIGSAVARRLVLDAEVIGVDIVPGKFTTHVGDITNRRFLDDVMHDIYAVVHCAAYHAPHVGVVDDSKFRNVNVSGTENLLNKTLSTKVKRFVYTSTTSVYGCSTRSKNEAVWVTEQLEPNPEDIYDETKLKAEDLCYNASKAGLDTIILRISRCFPEPDHLMVFYRLYRGVSREDVAEAHFQAVQSELKGFQVFNISASSPFVKEECKALLYEPWSIIDKRYPNARAQFLNAGWQLPKSIDRVYLIEKANKLLKYQPRRNFENILLEKISYPK
jgi:UDP-glucose 4-epimerase